MRMHLLGTAASDSFNDRLHDVAATAPGRTATAGRRSLIG